MNYPYKHPERGWLYDANDPGAPAGCKALAAISPWARWRKVAAGAPIDTTPSKPRFERGLKKIETGKYLKAS